MKKSNKISEFSYKKIAIMLVVLIVIIIVCISILSGNQAADSTTKKASFTKATVVKITDGDTIWVEYDGYKKKVRLIGIDCPEIDYYTNNENANDGELATDYTMSILSLGQTIYMQKDVSDTDEYGRLLRYVWIAKPNDTGSNEEIRTKMLNSMILINGYANANEYAPDTAYAGKFSKYESEAKENGAGLWSSLED